MSYYRKPHGFLDWFILVGLAALVALYAFTGYWLDICALLSGVALGYILDKNK